jgi:hypothetical protein
LRDRRAPVRAVDELLLKTYITWIGSRYFACGSTGLSR